MSHVKQIAIDQASGTVRRVYDSATARSGSVSELIQTMSIDAKSLQGSVGFYLSLMTVKNALDPATREMLGVVVSNVNSCYYAAVAHAEDYHRETGNKKKAERLIYDYRTAELDEKELALCDYAVKLTLKPGEMSEEDLDQLRGNGINDESIVVATQVISFFNYINRIANALGVEEETWMTVDPEEWMRKKATDFLTPKKKTKGK